MKPQNHTTTSKIKSDGEISITSAGGAHIPSQIKDKLGCGTKSSVAYICQAKVAILYNPNLTPDEFKKSLEILMLDLPLRIQPDMKPEARPY